MGPMPILCATIGTVLNCDVDVDAQCEKAYELSILLTLVFGSSLFHRFTLKFSFRGDCTNLSQKRIHQIHT